MRIHAALPAVIVGVFLLLLSPASRIAADPERPAGASPESETAADPQELERRVVERIDLIGEAIRASIDRQLEASLAGTPSGQCIVIPGGALDCLVLAGDVTAPHTRGSTRP